MALTQSDLHNAVAAILFAGFVAAAGITHWRGAGRNTRVRRFLVYAIGVSCLPVLAQRNFWPFNAWALIAWNPPHDANQLYWVGVDAAGREYSIDHRAWEPIPSDEFTGWTESWFVRLDSLTQVQVGRYLLGMVESARARARAESRVGSFDRTLRELTAPEFDLHPNPWSPPSAAPAAPFVGLRLYRLRWNLEERRRDPTAITTTLVFAYPPL